MAVENTGEIKVNSSFGEWIAKYAADTKYSRYLEIGTWDGRGSTCCFYEGFKTRTDSFTLQSYEVIKERAESAKNTWSFYPQIQVIHGRLLKDNECPLYTDILKVHPQVNVEWHNKDVHHFWKCSYLEANDPEVILLDGGEYFTYFEFKKLIKTTKASVYIMDDTCSDKCKKIVEWFELSPEWSHIASGDTRNGWAIYSKE
jgi:hypothetical protein